MNPNLLFVFADQWASWAVGHKNEHIKTPNIDSFYNESVFFENATTACPLCSPYRASLFTGKYPVKTGVYGNCMTGYPIALDKDELCFSDILDKNDYDTGYIGKWHLDEPESNFCKKPLSGATGWDAYTPQGKGRHHFRYWHSYGAADKHLNQHYWQDSPVQITTNKWSAEYEVDKAIEFLNEKREKPFALFISWNPPHPPFDKVPQKYLDMYDTVPLQDTYDGKEAYNHTGEQGALTKEDLLFKTRAYYSAITGIDEQFGRLVQYLKDTTKYDKTVIVLTSDHGEHMGSHNLVGKHTWYEESIAVPLYIRYPAALSPHVNNVCINTVNLMPTLLSLLEIQDTSIDSAKDLLPYICTDEKREDDYSFLSAYISRDIFIESCAKQGIKPYDMGWRAIRDKRYTYVIFRGYTPEDKVQIFLYDREENSSQTKPRVFNSIPAEGIALFLHTTLANHLKEENFGFFNWLQGVVL